ncbi:MAG: hypothetical protein HY827_07045 [Actinobacteria bacterium]|nr:hypothetical protein [Actinomycetota bacterium]
MAYIAKSRGDRWEIRESHVTAKGPRSVTLATFAVLDGETIARAASRSAGSVTKAELVRSARRVGAPVATDATRRAAGELLTALADGATLPPVVVCALTDAVGRSVTAGSTEPFAPSSITPSDAVRSAARWAGVDNRERAKALADLLLLADALPAPAKRIGKTFPRLVPAER